MQDCQLHGPREPLRWPEAKNSIDHWPIAAKPEDHSSLETTHVSKVVLDPVAQMSNKGAQYPDVLSTSIQDIQLQRVPGSEEPREVDSAFLRFLTWYPESACSAGNNCLIVSLGLLSPSFYRRKKKGEVF